MKKVQTVYSDYLVHITVSEETDDHMSVHSYGEPCSGVLRHWGSRAKLIKELKDIIRAIESLPQHEKQIKNVEQAER